MPDPVNCSKAVDLVACVALFGSPQPHKSQCYNARNRMKQNLTKPNSAWVVSIFSWFQFIVPAACSRSAACRKETGRPVSLGTGTPKPSQSWSTLYPSFNMFALLSTYLQGTKLRATKAVKSICFLGSSLYRFTSLVPFQTIAIDLEVHFNSLPHQR